MAAILEQVRMIVQEVIHVMGYPGIALIMFLENMFPPLPSEIVMPFAGFLVTRNQMTFLGVLLAGTAGAMLGAVVLYYGARKMGEKRVRNWVRDYGKYLLLSEQDFDRAMERFDEHGEGVVFISRLIPGVRSLISVPAGLDEMPVVRFLGFTLLGTVLWNALLAGAGMLLGYNWQRILGWIEKYELILLAVVGILFLYFIARRLKTRFAQ